MIERSILFKNKNGLHARPSARVAEISTQFKNCRTHLVVEGNEINSKSILNLIVNAIPPGTYITVRANGEREEEAVDALCAYLMQETLITEG